MSGVWAIILLLCAAFGALAVAVVHSLLADEVRAWLPHLARCLVRAAARRLPADSQARFEDDWLAELAAWDDRPMSALAKAAHIRWNARAIRESLGEVGMRGEGAKRALDVLVAAALLLLVAPVLLAISIAIKLDSRGPVLVRHYRPGRGGQCFPMFKFRSTYFERKSRGDQIQRQSVAGEEVTFTSSREARVTRVGRFIRRFSLDELPVLFNVTKGHMSLVGPRPMSLFEVVALKERGELGWTEMRPGLTGPWQIHNFVRGPYTLVEKRRMDEEYARSRSLFLDLRLLARTPWAVLRRPPE